MFLRHERWKFAPGHKQSPIPPIRACVQWFGIIDRQRGLELGECGNRELTGSLIVLGGAR